MSASSVFERSDVVDSSSWLQARLRRVEPVRARTDVGAGGDDRVVHGVDAPEVLARAVMLFALRCAWTSRSVLMSAVRGVAEHVVACDVDVELHAGPDLAGDRPGVAVVGVVGEG